jgi:hypothetical protein
MELDIIEKMSKFEGTSLHAKNEVAQFVHNLLHQLCIAEPPIQQKTQREKRFLT